jgi:hypothetical protein
VLLAVSFTGSFLVAGFFFIVLKGTKFIAL